MFYEEGRAINKFISPQGHILPFGKKLFLCLHIPVNLCFKQTITTQQFRHQVIHIAQRGGETGGC